MSQIIDFYSGKKNLKYSYKDVENFNDSQWENYHDFIQIVFPNREPSQHNPDAPLLTDEDLKILQEQYPLYVEDMVDYYMSFLGFLSCSYKGIRYYLQDNEDNISRVTHLNHNTLRITRLLKFLREFNQELCTAVFYTLISQDISLDIDLDYWIKAYKGE